ncbi:type IV secretory system conjugative DNA transfer family protein [Telmatospirillum sp.]|uniref:type IV secretory system conjugative DNA transfer family protein n=1 Tax=Telmatospirillum sp. TaxID=2079197 RepID=UPI002848AEE2|nr:type IV secretory system conjugative DNA transfer family protein [Telmatospirillum sp.]MDR3440109.1 type IV secretory system conjugative DNA transfer family protein [Telmatospirillum sp.]
MDSEVGKAVRWQLVSVTVALVVLVVGSPLMLPLSYLSERGVSLDTIGWVNGYFSTLLPHWDYWLSVYGDWLQHAVSARHAPVFVVALPALAVVVLGIGLGLNPHSMVPAIHGAARWARSNDIKRMGLLGGFIVVLGTWRHRWLKLPETLSVLCIAPPGTGKTAAVVVPSILTCDGASMVINDVKPELHAITSGFRQSLGPVIRLEWAAEDDPAGGAPHPRWNPLSPKSTPASGPQRDLFIDRLAAILIPDPQGNADPHWSKKGRAALTGLVHFILSKCEAGNHAGLPEIWWGAEPSFAMLLDWITEASFTAGEEVERLRESDPNAALMADPIRNFLMAAVAEARAGGYAHRAVMELTQLANTPDRERGSILSTVDAGLAVFKNSAVRQRTSVSDFAFSDLRGMPDPRSRKMRPVTVYLCVNQQDARALGVVTGLFIEALSAYLIAHPPGEADGIGGKVGPYPVLFVLDEFPQMPKVQALIDGPAVGRGQKLSYLLIGQDFAQIEEKYGKTGLETLLSTTAAKIVLPLNNEAVAKRFSDMVGNRTVEGQTRSRTYGFSKQANPFAVNINKSLSGVALIHPADFMSMPVGTHVLLMQKFSNRPIRAETPFYFKDHRLRRRAWDPRTGKGPRPAPVALPWPVAEASEPQSKKISNRPFGAGNIS